MEIFGIFRKKDLRQLGREGSANPPKLERCDIVESYGMEGSVISEANSLVEPTVCRRDDTRVHAHGAVESQSYPTG